MHFSTSTSSAGEVDVSADAKNLLGSVLNSGGGEHTHPGQQHGLLGVHALLVVWCK